MSTRGASAAHMNFAVNMVNTRTTILKNRIDSMLRQRVAELRKEAEKNHNIEALRDEQRKLKFRLQEINLELETAQAKINFEIDAERQRLSDAAERAKFDLDLAQVDASDKVQLAGLPDELSQAVNSHLKKLDPKNDDIKLLMEGT